MELYDFLMMSNISSSLVTFRAGEDLIVADTDFPWCRGVQELADTLVTHNGEAGIHLVYEEVGFDDGLNSGVGRRERHRSPRTGGNKRNYQARMMKPVVRISLEGVILVSQVRREGEVLSSGQSAGYPLNSLRVLLEREDRYGSRTFSHASTSVTGFVYIPAARSLKSSEACTAKSGSSRAEIVGALTRHYGPK